MSLDGVIESMRKAAQGERPITARGACIFINHHDWSDEEIADALNEWQAEVTTRPAGVPPTHIDLLYQSDRDLAGRRR